MFRHSGPDESKVGVSKVGAAQKGDIGPHCQLLFHHATARELLLTDATS